MRNAAMIAENRNKTHQEICAADAAQVNAMPNSEETTAPVCVQIASDGSSPLHRKAKPA